jgi:hypothetical protein
MSAAGKHMTQARLRRRIGHAAVNAGLKTSQGLCLRLMARGSVRCSVDMPPCASGSIKADALQSRLHAFAEVLALQPPLPLESKA